MVEATGPKEASGEAGAGAGKAASKKAAAKKTSTKKAASKKAASKKAAAKKPAAEKARVKKAGVRKASTRALPVEEPGAVATPAGATPQEEVAGVGGSARWALCACITQDLLNDLVLVAVGGGVPLEPLDKELALPALGEVRLRLGLTITGGAFDLRADDGGRARAVITADGDVSVRASDYEGDTVEGAPFGLPAPAAAIPVRVEALVDPFLELRDDHTVSVGLDLRRAELVSLAVDPDAPVPEGVDPASWTGMTQMMGMMFGAMGDNLFAALGEHVGSVGMDLGEDVGMVLHDLGVAHGPADARVSSGLLSFGLRAQDDVVGRAEPVPIAGKRLGFGLSSSGVDRLAHKLLERAVGDLPLPFELEVDLGEQQVGAQLRQVRVLSSRFPDLRSAFRTEVRPRLVGGRLELTVQAAWLQLPSLVPSVFNDLSRRLGGLLSLAPLRFRLPATVGLPIVPGSDDTVPVRVDDLRVTTDGMGVVLALD